MYFKIHMGKCVCCYILNSKEKRKETEQRKQIYPKWMLKPNVLWCVLDGL